MRRVLISILACLSCGLAQATEPPAPFSIELRDAPAEVLLGMPVMLHFYLKNVSGAEQPFPFVSMRIRLELLSRPKGEEQWFRSARGLQEEGETIYNPERKKTLAADWEQWVKTGFMPPCAGEYRIRAVLFSKPSWSVPISMGEIEDHWVGEVVTRAVNVKVREPEGIDAEAFLAVCALKPENWSEPITPAGCYRMSWFPKPPTGAFQLLMRHYRDSTYAAYEIYRHFDHGYTGVDSDVYNRFSKAEVWRGFSGKCACDSEGNPKPKLEKWPEFKGVSYLKCRENWFRIALKKHPDTWFADDMRFILAGDAYFFGDKDQCRKILTDLAKQGRPYVAMKAGKLLRDMQAKNMLPGGPQELATAPAQAQPEGKAAQ